MALEILGRDRRGDRKFWDGVPFFSRFAKNSERVGYLPPFAIKPTLAQPVREHGAKVIETYGPVVYV